MKLRLIVLAGFLALVIPVFAHHSFAMFDTAKSITIDGTVTKFEWTNPHSWLWVEVKDDQGGSKVWGIETGSPWLCGFRVCAFVALHIIALAVAAVVLGEVIALVAQLQEGASVKEKTGEGKGKRGE